MIRAIVAVDEKWGIGKKNGLLFSIPEDMKYFRKTTIGSTVCMGYNTLLSFPDGKPLPNRRNITLCPESVNRKDLLCVHSLDDMLKAIASEKNDVYIIGGAMFYHTMLPYCEEVLVTKVSADGGAEVFFDNLDKDKRFKCVSISDEIVSNGYKIYFTKYINNKVTRC